MDSQDKQGVLLNARDAAAIIIRASALVGLLLSLTYIPVLLDLTLDQDGYLILLVGLFSFAPSLIFLIVAVYAAALSRFIVPDSGQEKLLSLSDHRGIELVLVSMLGLWAIVDALPAVVTIGARLVAEDTHVHSFPWETFASYAIQLLIGIVLLLQANGVQSLVRRLRTYGQ